MITFTRFLTVVLVFALTFPVFAKEDKDEALNYVGADGCKVCHTSKKSGAAYKIWQKSKHAQAYATLASEKAKAIAQKKGIANAQQSDECIQCHVTAYHVEAARLGKKYKIEDGVGCESCHGPGSKYKSKKVKKGIVAGKIDRTSVGLVIPKEENCRECHNEKSPTFKEFNFKERLAKIAHLKPDKDTAAKPE